MVVLEIFLKKKQIIDPHQQPHNGFKIIIGVIAISLRSLIRQQLHTKYCKAV